MGSITQPQSGGLEIKGENEITRITLLRLQLRHFKGLKHFDLDSHAARVVSIYGDNATGKTTLADAFSWLLIGKDSQGHAEFEIKTLTDKGEALHGLDHAVEADLLIGGAELKLRKVYKEKWTKRRGSAEKEFTGHTKDHFVDGVPVGQSNYDERIGLFASEDLFRLLSSPIEFAERLHWQERRRVLLDVCGDISDADVIAASPALADLPEILAGRSIDDRRKIAEAAQREINKQLQRIPVRIDEVSRSLPAATGDASLHPARLNALRESRTAAEAERSRIETGGEIAEKTKQLREVEAALLNETNLQRALDQTTTQKLRQDLDSAQDELDASSFEVKRLKLETSQAKEEINSLEPRMNERRTRWHQIDAEVFTPEPGDDSCAACGQKLPTDRVEETRAKALAAFNADKARRLQETAEEGKRFLARCNVLRSDSEKRIKEILHGQDAAGKLRERNERRTAEIAQVEAGHAASFPSSDECALMDKKRNLESEIERLRGSNMDALKVMTDKLSDFDRRIVEVEREVSRLEFRCTGEQRIEELKREERRLAGEYEVLERQIYLCGEFTQHKVSMLTERINKRFELAGFKLFNVLVNGGIEECCEVSSEGVPWASLNTGAQVNIGLDIIRTLSAHFRIAPPIFIDHSESVTKLLATPGQQIRLIVSGAQKHLHVEHDTFDAL